MMVFLENQEKKWLNYCKSSKYKLCTQQMILITNIYKDLHIRIFIETSWKFGNSLKAD